MLACDALSRHDMNSNPLYRENEHTSGGAFSELYHPNGSTGGYDRLNRLTEFRRGTLTGTDTIANVDSTKRLNRGTPYVFRLDTA